MRTKCKRIAAILIVFAMCITTGGVGIRFKTVKAAGQEGVPGDMKQITFTDFGMERVCETSSYLNTYKNGANLAGTVLGGTINAQTGARVFIGGTSSGGWSGIQLYFCNDDTLFVKNGPEGVIEGLGEGIKADAAGVSKFTGTDLAMQMSFELVDHDEDGIADDLKLGIWFGRKLYNNTYFYMDDYQGSMGNYIHVAVGPVKLISEEPEETMPEYLKRITFTDFGMESVCETSSYLNTYKNGANLAGTVLGGTINAQTGARVFIGGTSSGGWNGIQLYFCNDDTLFVKNGPEGVIEGLGEGIKADAAGVSKFTGTDLAMQMSFELVDHDEDGIADDLKLGLWFGGKLYNNKYVYLDDYKGSMGNYIHVAVGPVKLMSVEQQTLPEDFKKITFSDFGIQEGTHTTTQVGTYRGGSLNETVFTGKLTGTAGAVLMIGGVEENQGLALEFGESDITLYNADGKVEGFEGKIFTSHIAGTALVGEELNLQISFAYVDHDEDGTANDLKLGVWFNKTLYGNRYIYINNYTDRAETLGSTMTLTGTMKVKNVRVETLSEDLKEITYTDFGIQDGTITADISGMYSGSSLDKTVLTGTVNAAPGASIFIGGTENWHGIWISFNESAITMRHTPGTVTEFPEVVFYADKVGTPLTNTDLNLQISFEFVNNDGGETANDLKLGMWFDGKLYDNEYVYINNYVDREDTMGRNLQIYGPAGRVTVTSVKQETLPENLKEITFRDFGIQEGISNKIQIGTYQGGSLNGTLFTGKLTGTAGAVLMIGGVEGNQGLALEFGESDITLYNADGKVEGFEGKIFTSHIAGTVLVGKELKLQISFAYVDHDEDGIANDLKLGVWFNKTLYGNRYIYINNYTDRAETLGSTMTLTGTMKVRNVSTEAEALPDYLKEITFTDFGIKDGTYNMDRSGKYYGKSLDKTVLTGTVNVQPGALFIIGGTENWRGIVLAFGKNIITLDNAYGKVDGFPKVAFKPDVVGVSDFVGIDLKLQISFEFVDNDDGGTANDLKLGMWFNGKLYENEYIYINNYVDREDTMGCNLQLYGVNGAITVTSVFYPIEFERFGLTENWADTLLTKKAETNVVGGSITSEEDAFTGDVTTYLLWTGMVIVALASIVYSGYRMHKKGRECD